MIKIVIIISVMITFMVPPAFATTALNLGPATITASTVSFPVVLSNTRGTSISGITADIVFNSDKLALVMDGANPISATAGVAATASGKQLIQSSPSEGVLHIVIIDLNGITPISDGTVAQVSFTIRASAASGDYSFAVVPTATDSQGNNIAIIGGNLSIPVPINGSCGTSDGQSFSVKPAANLCAIGTSSTILGFGPWNWSCAGANGGTTASCSALLVPSQAPKFNVTPMTGSNYTITPATTQSINSNTSTSFTVTPAVGYGVIVVGCEGTLVGTIFTTGAITSNCSINITPIARTASSSVSGPTISDAIKVLQAVVGRTSLTPTEKIRYDVAPLGFDGIPAGNGSIDAADVILILRRSIGIGSW